jgi:ubiquitin C-terminal hydrolase
MFKKPELVLTKKCAKNRHKSILNESCKVDPSDQSKTYLEIFSSSSFKRKIDDSISSEKIINKRIRYEGSEMGFPNLGQSCYMNAILQCLVEMNYFFNHPLRPTKIFDDFSIEKFYNFFTIKHFTIKFKLR